MVGATESEKGTGTGENVERELQMLAGKYLMLMGAI